MPPARVQWSAMRRWPSRKRASVLRLVPTGGKGVHYVKPCPVRMARALAFPQPPLGQGTRSSALCPLAYISLAWSNLPLPLFNRCHHRLSFAASTFFFFPIFHHFDYLHSTILVATPNTHTRNHHRQPTQPHVITANMGKIGRFMAIFIPMGLTIASLVCLAIVCVGQTNKDMALSNDLFFFKVKLLAPHFLFFSLCTNSPQFRPIPKTSRAIPT